MLISNDQLDEGLLAVDMEAPEYLWVGVGVKTNGAVELILDGFFSHYWLAQAIKYTHYSQTRTSAYNEETCVRLNLMNNVFCHVEVLTIEASLC